LLILIVEGLGVSVGKGAGCHSCCGSSTEGDDVESVKDSVSDGVSVISSPRAGDDPSLLKGILFRSLLRNYLR
jgi:hypothetical protein